MDTSSDSNFLIISRNELCGLIENLFFLHARTSKRSISDEMLACHVLVTWHRFSCSKGQRSAIVQGYFSPLTFYLLIYDLESVLVTFADIYFTQNT